MSEIEEGDGGLDAFLNRDHAIPQLTAEAVKDALSRFPHALADDRTWTWLATALRRALAMNLQGPSESPDRQSNADTKKELQSLAQRVDKLWLAIFGKRSAEADDALFRHALRNWDGEGGKETSLGVVLGDPAEWRRFQAALRELEWLSSFMRSAAQQLPSQAPRWTQAERREIRIQWAQCLAPVYLSAFRLNGLNGTTFGDFYQRIISLAFKGEDIADFEAVISEGRRRHSKDPIIFSPTYIPGL